MKENERKPKQIGNLTELQCITRLYELGCSISIPYGDSEKYDFILDVNGNLYKFNANMQLYIQMKKIKLIIFQLIQHGRQDTQKIIEWNIIHIPRMKLIISLHIIMVKAI